MKLADRVLREAGSDPRDQIERVWLIVYSRPPSEKEMSAALPALENLRALNVAAPDAGDKSSETETSPGSGLLAPPALTAFCHTLLNTAAFIYVD